MRMWMHIAAHQTCLIGSNKTEEWRIARNKRKYFLIEIK